MKSQMDDLNKDGDQTFRGDAIGSTVYSQRFVLKTLLKLQEFNSDSYQKELNKDDEDSLCNLWDMSADKEVANYLINECNAVYLFTNLVLSLSCNEDSNIPKRLEEISVGILANIFPSLKSGQRIEFATSYPNFPVNLLDYHDGPFLVQAIRFWRCLIYDIEGADDENFNLENHPWKSLMVNINEWFHRLEFILQSSTDTELLTSTIEFIYWLISLEIPDSSEKNIKLEEAIATKKLIGSLLECTKELKDQANSLTIINLQSILTKVLEILRYCFIRHTEIDSDQKELLKTSLECTLECFFEDNKEQKDLMKYEMPEPFITQMLIHIQNKLEKPNT